MLNLVFASSRMKSRVSKCTRAKKAVEMNDFSTKSANVPATAATEILANGLGTASLEKGRKIRRLLKSRSLCDVMIDINNAYWYQASSCFNAVLPNLPYG